MEKNNKKDEKLKLSYSYVFKDGSTMKEEEIIKKEKRFKKLYIDTVKHEQDIRKWIASGKRKKGDIRRSIEGLENKYLEIKKLNDEFVKKGLYDSKFCKEISIEERYNLVKVENSINELYSLAKIERKNTNLNNRQNLYGKDIDLVTDIPDNSEMLGLVKISSNNKLKKEKKNFFNFKKVARRVATFAMAMIMTAFSGVKAGDNKSYNHTNEGNSYTDTNRKTETENFKDSLYVDVAESINKETTPQETTQAIKVENFENKENIDNIKYISDDESEYFIAPEGITYTEVSDGSGASGYFTVDTEVKVYNRALIKTDKNGNKKILEVTKPGQTWKEYAEENNLDYNEFKEYMNNNKNIKKCVSLESANGENEYGWVLENTLQEKDKTGEKER